IVALPNDAAIEGVERIHIIRFGYRNDRRPTARAGIDVKRLRIDVADDRAVKVEVPRQIGRGAQRESGVNIKTVPRSVIVKLRYVHLRVCGRDCAPKANDDRRSYRKRMLHTSVFNSSRALLP